MDIVVYTQRVEIVESYNERRDCADQRISDFIYHCGYAPVALPNDANQVESIVEEIHPTGIILTGGNSLVKYGGNAPERDETDRFLIQYAIDNSIPLYGFCRGMQSILDYWKCELVTVDGHVAVRHIVSGDEGRIEVNSYHNQGCIKLSGDELVAELRANDGVIEKVRHTTYPIIGTMWHPEREDTFTKRDIDMVKKIFGGNV